MKKIFRTMMAIAITAFTFAACQDVPEPYELPTTPEEEVVTYTGSGTLASPYTVEDVVKYVQALDGNESDTAVYVKGVIKSITEEFTTQYGNGTFKICFLCLQLMFYAKINITRIVCCKLKNFHKLQ